MFCICNGQLGRDLKKKIAATASEHEVIGSEVKCVCVCLGEGG